MATHPTELPQARHEQSIDEYLREAMPDSTFRTRQRLLKFGRVLINGTAAGSNEAVVRAGDRIEISAPVNESGEQVEEGQPTLKPTRSAKAPALATRTVKPPLPRSAASDRVGRPRPQHDRSDSRPPRGEAASPRAALERAEPGDRFLRGGIRLVFENDDLIVVDKPPGIVTASPTPTREPTAFDILKVELRSRPGRKFAAPPRGKAQDRGRSRAVQPLWVIHRLDKEASGLVVFAKSTRAYEWLKEDFRSKRVHRLYVALVQGEVGPVGHTGTMQTFLQEDTTGKVRSLPPEAYRGPPSPPTPATAQPSPSVNDRRGGPHGKRGRSDGEQAAKLAVTHYRVLGTAQGLSLVQVRLETGRKNQIRVHFSERGHPLAGDRKYSAEADPVGRMALHATELSFSDPATGQTMRFSSPAPASFYRAVGLPPPAGGISIDAPRPTPKAASGRASDGPLETSWDEVAEWYDQLLEDKGSDHYEQVILPGTLRLLSPKAGSRVLDVACGQGILCRRLAGLGVSVTGVEASPRLIDAAKERGGSGAEGGSAEYHVADARSLEPLGLNGFDAAVCTMALGNIEPLSPVMQGVASALRPGGRFVMVVSHPAFRAPGQTAWGWDERQHVQYRRVEGYLSPGQKAIEMHPGKRARGQGGATTWTFHRPIQAYVKALADAGFAVDALEEWPGQRVSQPGPKAKEENRIRREIPLFLAIRAVKTAGAASV